MRLTLFLLFSVIVLGACNRRDEPCIQPTALFNRTVVYKDTLCNAIAVNIPANIYLEQDTSLDFLEIHLDAQDSVIKYTSMAIINHQMVVEFTQCISNHNDIGIKIRFPRLERFSTNSVGTAVTTKLWKQDSLSVINSGRGAIELVLDVDSLNTANLSSGSIELFGEAIQNNITTYGLGTITCNEIFTDSVYIDSRSTGDVYTHANNYLNATLIGDGNVYYTGNPVVATSGSGSGTVVNNN